MLLPDINILVYAYWQNAPNHEHHREWLLSLVNGEDPFGLADIVCSGFLRVATNPAVFTPAPSLDQALVFIEGLRDHPNCVVINPGPRHWRIFANLCKAVGAKGKLVPDAYLAALAIESGSDWISTDGDFARFPGLRWRRPF